MIRTHKTTRTLPYYRPVPLTYLPLLYQREHQRYVRTEFWKKACEHMGSDAEHINAYLHEDALAEFGAHWSD